AVLVPRDRGAAAGLLDPQRLVEGREVGTIDGSGDGQQLRMAVDAQRGLGERQRAQDEEDDLLGQAVDSRFVHFYRVTAVGGRGAAPLIAEWPCPMQDGSLAVG